MKKNIFSFILVLVLAVSCEKDDICVETITPQLVIRFYDINNPTETKDVPSLNVWADGKDTIVNNQTIDSIAIPLDVNELQTIYNLRSESIVDQITISYGIDEVYVSRSCGFIANYNALSISNTSNWIQDIEVISTTIENENEAHVQIRH